jgi:CheY-like chemotaxis protein/HPt (histidine-containing phosphotransfer) domain-containing protein
MRPTVVENAFDALRELEQAQQAGEPFSLVLLDAHMPEVDGFTLAERIRENPDLAGATVMMLSSAGQSIDMRRCNELGLAAYLTKPIKQADLFRAIMAALGNPPAEPAESVQTAPMPPRAGRALRLLLAEDNLVNQKLALRLLEKQGHTVAIAANGIEAVRAAEHEPFDLVLMDVQMPEMDGFEATAAIRAREQGTGRHLPILAMTAYAMKGDRERCLASGMDGYVSKPIQPRELWQAIKQLVPTDTAPTTEPPSLEDILDRNEALERVGGDTALLRELVELYLAESAHLRQDIARALQARDAPKLGRTAHTLKGAVSTFGAHAAREAAEQVELLGKKGDLTYAAGAVACLESELKRLEPALEKMKAEGERPA